MEKCSGMFLLYLLFGLFHAGNSVQNVGLKEDSCDKGFVRCKFGMNWRTIINSSCIPVSRVCDGASDCSDNSDERYCSYSMKHEGFVFKYARGPCDLNWVMCPSGVDKRARKYGCIPVAWINDRKTDCKLFDEESSYLPYNRKVGFSYKFKQGGCPQGYYICKNGTVKSDVKTYSNCLKKELICDGETDCDDNSDEFYCPYIFPVEATTPSSSTLGVTNSTHPKCLTASTTQPENLTVSTTQPENLTVSTTQPEESQPASSQQNIHSPHTNTPVHESHYLLVAIVVILIIIGIINIGFLVYCAFSTYYKTIRKENNSGENSLKLLNI